MPRSALLCPQRAGPRRGPPAEAHARVPAGGSAVPAGSSIPASGAGLLSTREQAGRCVLHPPSKATMPPGIPWLERRGAVSTNQCPRGPCAGHHGHRGGHSTELGALKSAPCSTFGLLPHAAPAYSRCQRNKLLCPRGVLRSLGSLGTCSHPMSLLTWPQHHHGQSHKPWPQLPLPRSNDVF